RQPQRAVERVALRLLQLDLELRAAARRLAPQQLLHRALQRRGERLQQRQPGLAPAVLQQGQLRRGAPHALAELREREAAGAPEVPEALPERHEIYVTRQVEGFFFTQGRHGFIVAEISHFFCYSPVYLGVAAGA